MGTIASVTHGTTMVIIEQFNPGKVLQIVQDEKCTALHGVPTMFIAELNHPDFAQFELSTLRTGIMAGSICPIEVMKKVMEDMGACEITIAYGQTESSPVITQTKTDDPIEKRCIIRWASSPWSRSENYRPSYWGRYTIRSPW